MWRIQLLGGASRIANYSGDAAHQPSTASLTVTVAKRSATVTLSGAPASAPLGQAVSLSTTVSGTSPTGQVQFLDGAQVMATVALNAGTATHVTGPLSSGTHSFTVAYLGDGNHNPATSAAASTTVSQGTPSVSMGTSAPIITTWQSVTLVATIAGVAGIAPTGSVIFRDGTVTIGTMPMSGGYAALVTASLPIGARQITAAYSGDANYIATTSAVLTQQVLRPVSTDFDINSRSDMLWHNASTGQAYRMSMNGFAIIGEGSVYTEPNVAWKIVGDGDFNRNGVSDLLWRNELSGAVALVTLNASGVAVSVATVWTEPNLQWSIVHTPDLDGDGRTDILWWNSVTGEVSAMLMNGTAITLLAPIPAGLDASWRIAAVGDFAGSGKTNQLVWWNSVTGQVKQMTVSVAGGVFSQSSVAIYTEPNTAWKVLGAPDFNGDGKSDLLWRNEATGQIYGLLMNGAAITAQAVVYVEPNLAWKVVAQGDYNGDRKADLLWRNETTGQVYMMLMNGLAIGSQALVYTEPNTAWKLMGPWEYAQ